MLGKQWSIMCLFYVCSSVGVGSNLTQYLSKRHRDWTEGSTPAYLATVVGNLSQVGSGVDSRSLEEAVIVTIGNGGRWKGYINGALKANKQYRYGQGHISGFKEKILVS